MQKDWASKWSRYLIYFILAVLPLERIPSFELHSPVNASIRLSQLAGLVLITINLPLLWQKRRQWLSGPWKWLAGFVFICIISGALALDLRRAVFVTAYTAFVFMLAWTVSLRLERDRLLIYGRILIGSALLACLFGFYQFFGDLFGLPTNLTGLRPQYTKGVFGFPRIQSTALEPLYFADYLLIPITLLMSSYIYRWHRLRHWLLFLPLLTVVWLTLSRGAFAAMAIIALILGIVALSKKHFSELIGLTAGVLVTIGLAIGLIALGSSVGKQPSGAAKSVKRFSTQTTNVDVGESSEGRALSRRLALEAFTKHPLLGIGPGNFGFYAHQQLPVRFGDASAIVNNEPLEILAETGLFGALMFAGFGLSLLWLIFKRLLNQPNNLNKIWLVALSLCLLAVAVQYQTFSTLYITHIWVAIGLLLGLIGPRHEELA